MFQRATPAVTTIMVRSSRGTASPFVDAASSIPPKNRITPRTGMGNRERQNTGQHVAPRDRRDVQGWESEGWDQTAEVLHQGRIEAQSSYRAVPEKHEHRGEAWPFEEQERQRRSRDREDWPSAHE